MLVNQEYQLICQNTVLFCLRFLQQRYLQHILLLNVVCQFCWHFYAAVNYVCRINCHGKMSMLKEWYICFSAKKGIIFRVGELSIFGHKHKYHPKSLYNKKSKKVSVSRGMISTVVQNESLEKRKSVAERCLWRLCGSREGSVRAEHGRKGRCGLV